VVERGLRRGMGLRHARFAASCQFQERLCGLRRQMVRNDEDRVLGRALHILEPLDRHAAGRSGGTGQTCVVA
jgi:hypothetical protein